MEHSGAAVSFAAARGRKIRYTCPMHPEIIRFGPGSCPICGMALEPVTSSRRWKPIQSTLMRLRFWVSAALSLPVLLLSMLGESLGLHLTSTCETALSFFSPRQWSFGEAGPFSNASGPRSSIESNMFS